MQFHLIRTIIYEPLKLHLIALVNLLVVIATLLLVALGSTIYERMDLTTDLLVMAGTILLTLTTLANFINSVKLIRTWRHSLRGGNRTYIEHYKN